MALRARLSTSCCCLLPALLFLLNFVVWTTGDTRRLDERRRYGEDMAVATTAFLEHVAPTHRAAVLLSSEEARAYMRDLQRFISKMVARHDIRPWQFWRTLPRHPPPRPGPVLHRMNDDVGRAWLTAGTFRLLGGVAPFMLLWLAALLCTPVLIWLVWELTRAGHRTAGLVFGALCACSPFCVESMALPCMAFGFYLVGILVVVALSVSVLLGEPRSFRAGAWRSLAAGVILAVCALCRSATVLLLPGALVALTLSVLRQQRGRRDWRRAGAQLALGAVLLLGPTATMRPPRHHELWLGVWMGLGDFDRTKGHSWSDPVARAFLIQAGFDSDVPPAVPVYELDVGAPEKESFFRKSVLADVRSDPAWYLGILARRAFVTLTQSKLQVFGAQRSPAAVPAPTFGEGKISFYYSRVPTADQIGLSAFRRVLPLPMLWLLGPAFMLWAVGKRHDPQARATLKVLTCVCVSIMALPVLITTASALETEAFVFAYFLVAGFLAEDLVRRAVKRARSAPEARGSRDQRSNQESSASEPRPSTAATA